MVYIIQLKAEFKSAFYWYWFMNGSEAQRQYIGQILRRLTELSDRVLTVMEFVRDYRKEFEAQYRKTGEIKPEETPRLKALNYNHFACSAEYVKFK